MIAPERRPQFGTRLGQNPAYRSARQFIGFVLFFAAATSDGRRVLSSSLLTPRVAGNSPKDSTVQKWPLELPDLAGVCSGDKFVVSTLAAAYDARARGPNRKSRSALVLRDVLAPALHGR
jgi:hypothetical protein